MSKILGKNVILYMIVNASPEQRLPIACGRTASLTTNVVTAPISTVGSGVYSEFQALSINWSVSVDGLATFDENMSLATLRMYQFQLTPMLIEFKETAGTTSVTYSGSVIITSVQTSGSYSDVETFNVELQGTGVLFNSGDFRIIGVSEDDPDPGTTTLTFTFVETPGISTYTIRIRDLITGEITNDTQGSPPHSLPVESDHSYAFAYRTQTPVVSDWSPEIYWNLDATSDGNFMINSDGAFLINSDEALIVNT